MNRYLALGACGLVISLVGARRSRLGKEFLANAAAKMKLFIAISILALSLVPLHSATASGRWVYLPSSSGGGVETEISLVDSAVTVGDRRIGAKFCDPNSRFYCIVSETLKFSVPHKLTAPQKWLKHGQYQAISRVPIAHNGSFVHVWLIRTKQSGMRADFLYSEKFGLLEIVGYVESRAIKLHVDGVCGFPFSC